MMFRMVRKEAGKKKAALRRAEAKSSSSTASYKGVQNDDDDSLWEEEAKSPSAKSTQPPRSEAKGQNGHSSPSKGSGRAEGKGYQQQSK